MSKCFSVLIVFVGLFHISFSLFGETTIKVTKETTSPYRVRQLKHVYYVGTVDNGTLSCQIPGAVSYNWKTISKEVVHDSHFVNSWEGELKIPNPNKPWEVDITVENYVTDSMVVICEAKNGYGKGQLFGEVVWVITRLHSPLGYITDPIICPSSKYDECKNTKFFTRQECQADVLGESYRGTHAKTRDGTKCSDWNMATFARWGALIYSAAELHKFRGMNYKYFTKDKHHSDRWFLKVWGEHNYCRSPVKGQKKFDPGPQCFPFPDAVKMTKRDRKWFNTKLAKHCEVPKCSDCMYGVGDGKLLRYKITLPGYQGRGKDTYYSFTKKKKIKVAGGREEERVVKFYRQCYRNPSPKSAGEEVWYHKNFCTSDTIAFGRIRFTNKKGKPPFCLVQRGNKEKHVVVNVKNGKQRMEKLLVTATCRIRQCTVRLVWFLFLDEDKQLVIHTSSSSVPQKFAFVAGAKSYIYFFAFGMHLTSGMSIIAIDKKKQSVVRKWEYRVLRVPQISRLYIGQATKKMEGLYYLQYEFQEADSRIDVGKYLQKFQIEVKEPMKVSLSPSKVTICESEEGVVKLKISGDFSATKIKWSYTLYETMKPILVQSETAFIRLSNDLMKATVSQTAWIHVVVYWKHGRVNSEAKVNIVGKPVLQNLSPLLLLIKPGEPVKIAVATNDVANDLKWILDAQSIAEVPDDPDMGFSRLKTSKEVIHILKIDNVQEHHYGLYTVKATNRLKCQQSMDFILRQPPAISKEHYVHPSQVPLTKEGFAQFQGVMDFMNQECAEIMNSSTPRQIKIPSSKNISITAKENEESEERKKEDGWGKEEWEEKEEEWGEEEEWRDEEEYKEEESEGGLKRRKKRNAPVMIEEAVSMKKPLCIHLRTYKPYFEVNLGFLTRIKGIRLLKPLENENVVLFNHSYRLLYSLNGCQWKIYGIWHYKSQTVNTAATTDNSTNFATNNNTSIATNNKTNGTGNSTSQVRQEVYLDLVTRLQTTVDTITFSASDSITWIGNASLVFARHIRLVPTELDGRNKTCIRVNVYGCSAAILDIPKKPEEQVSEGDFDVIAIVAGFLGGILGFALLVVGVLVGLKKWKIIQRQKKAKKDKKKKSSMTYQTYDDSDDSSDSSDSSDRSEHFYWEITN